MLKVFQKKPYNNNLYNNNKRNKSKILNNNNNNNYNYKTWMMNLIFVEKLQYGITSILKIVNIRPSKQKKINKMFYL